MNTRCRIIQTPVAPCAGASSKQKTKQKHKPNHQQDYHLTQSCPSEKKQTNKNLNELSPHTSQSAAAAAAKSLQSCPTLCDPIDGSPPGSTIPGVLQARTLEWAAIAFSPSYHQKVYKPKMLGRVWRKRNTLALLVGM